MNHGLSHRTLATLRAALARQPEIQRAILYGSRALGTWREGSDIDLALVGPNVDTQSCSRLWQALDASDIPFRVDITALASLTNPDLKTHIERVGITLYERPPLAP